VKWFSRFRHYNNLHKCEARLRRLLGDFQFSTMRDVLEQRGLLQKSTGPAATPKLAAAGA